MVPSPALVDHSLAAARPSPSTERDWELSGLFVDFVDNEGDVPAFWRTGIAAPRLYHVYGLRSTAALAGDGSQRQTVGFGDTSLN